MSAANGGSLSDEPGSGSVEVRNRPISLDQLSVSLLTESGHESKVIFAGFLCRRERLEDDSDDRFSLYWAVLRAKQLFLFHNESSPQCKEIIMLSHFVYKLNPEVASNWPKGLKTCTLAAPESNGCSGGGSWASEQPRQHQLGWWPALYRWQEHIQKQVARAWNDPAAAQAECRQLLISAQELSSSRAEAAAFKEPELPVKRPGKPKGLRGLLRLGSNGRDQRDEGSGGGGSGGGSNSLGGDRRAPSPQAQPPALDDDDEDEDVYAAPDDDRPTDSMVSAEDEVYEVPDFASPTPQAVENLTPQPVVQNPPPPLPQPLLKPPTGLPLPPKPCITKEMLGKQQLRPTLLRQQSGDDAGVGGGVAGRDDSFPPQLPQRPTPAPRHTGDRGVGGGGVPAMPPASPLPPALPSPRPSPPHSTGGLLWQQLASGEAADASVSYFYHAFDSQQRLQDVASKLEGTQAGTFLVHGCARSSHRNVLTLLVQSGTGVCRFYIKETNGGVRFTTVETIHESLNQLLFHHHLYDLPACNESKAALRLREPARLPGRANFLSASVWCLGEKALCLGLLGGTPDGTYALLADPATKQISLYATSAGKRVKLRIQMKRLGAHTLKFWAMEEEQFDSLEEFLVHYHRKSLIVNGESGQPTALRLVTPCQLSEAFATNLLAHLTDKIEERTTDNAPMAAEAGAAVVSTRQYGDACIRTETLLDDDEFRPTLAIDGRQPSQTAVDVQETLVRGFQCIYSVPGRPEMQFDSLDKLLLYANLHPEKLA